MTWLSGWQYRKAHTITGTSAGAQTNYQVGIKVYYGTGTDGIENVNGITFGKVYCNSQCKTDFGDLRFTSSDGSTLLDHWIESKGDSDYATVWVEIDSIPANPDTKTVYVYYGKADATTLSNGDATFPFFDDFNDGVVDQNKWTIATLGNGSVTENGGELICHIPPEANQQANVTAKYGIQIYGMFRAKLRTSNQYINNLFRAWGWNNAPKYAMFDTITTNGLAGLTYDTTQQSSTYESYTLTTAHVYDVLWTNGQAVFNHDGTTLATITVQVPSTALNVYLQNASSYAPAAESYVYVDYVFAKKYVSVEPTHSLWGTEENQPLIDLEVGTLTVDNNTTTDDLTVNNTTTTYDLTVSHNTTTDNMTVTDTATIHNLEADTMTVQTYVENQHQTNVETNNLTVDNVLTIKAPYDHYIEIKGIQGMTGPIIESSQGIFAKNDILTYGMLACRSDPDKGTGGGAIMMGHGFQSTPRDEPRFILTDTLSNGHDAHATVSVVNGIVDCIKVLNRGTNYTWATAHISSLTGTEAELSTEVEDGKIKNIKVDNEGKNYLVSDEIIINGDGNDAHAVISTKDGLIKSVDIVPNSGGADYQFADVTVDGLGYGAELETIINQTVHQIERIDVHDGGHNYRSADIVTIVGDGIRAKAALVVDNGVITSVSIMNPGMDYSKATTVVGGFGARLAPVINFDNGEITNINVFERGQGYSSLDSVSITNDAHSTLYLQKTAGTAEGVGSPNYLPGNLDLGDLTVHGSLKFDGSDNYTAIALGNKRIIYAHNNDDFDLQTPNAEHDASIRRITIQGGANSGEAGIFVYEGLVPKATNDVAPSLGHPPTPEDPDGVWNGVFGQRLFAYNRLTIGNPATQASVELAVRCDNENNYPCIYPITSCTLLGHHEKPFVAVNTDSVFLYVPGTTNAGILSYDGTNLRLNNSPLAQGPQGPTGPQGPMGPQGIQGPPGTVGNHASTHGYGSGDQIGIDGAQIVSGTINTWRLPWTSMPTSGIQFINGGTIYWQTGTNPNVFEMNAGLIVDGAINAGSGLIVTGNTGVSGSVNTNYINPYSGGTVNVGGNLFPASTAYSLGSALYHYYSIFSSYAYFDNIIPLSAGGVINIYNGRYRSSDGTLGYTGNIPANSIIHVKDGIVTGYN
jgi:hypothetical protein